MTGPERRPAISDLTTYTSDPRVSTRDGGYTVHVDGETIHVLPSPALGWGAYTGPNLDLIITTAGPWTGFPTADVLIAALLQADDG
jgi:hypothetical protein